MSEETKEEKKARLTKQFNDNLLQEIDDYSNIIGEIGVLKNAIYNDIAYAKASRTAEIPPELKGVKGQEELKQRLTDIQENVYEGLSRIFNHIEKAHNNNMVLEPRLQATYAYKDKLENSVESLESFAQYSKSLKRHLG